MTIAIVDAFDNPYALQDLQVFSTQFGLPMPNTFGSPTFNFQVVYATGTQPAFNEGWSTEIGLDIEWAQAMSPTANIILVEAATNSWVDLMAAVQVAASQVASAGGGFVSMSWGNGEFPFQTTYDSTFSSASPTVTFLAATGDAPGVHWPSSSQYVVAVGGTSLSRNPSTGNFLTEQTWTPAGGGISALETMPSFQKSISSKLGGHRGTPDIAAIANPDTGVWVYDAGYCFGSFAWCIVGGTSVATPVSAGILSLKGVGTSKPQQMLTDIYTSTAFHDVTYGDCGPYVGWKAATGWDLCTGKGSMIGGTTKLVVTSGYAP